MPYLKIDRTLIANLDESLQREYIRTNRMGAYASSTIVDCNTRKYHGLLVVPLPEISANNHVLLSSLDLSIIQHGAEFNVGLHEYEGEIFSPNGHKYIREYNVEVVPSTIYRVGGVLLKKEWLFCHLEHRVIIKYSLLEAHSDTVLRFRPFLAFRDVSMLTYENDAIDRTHTEVDRGVSMRLYPHYPALFMQFASDVVYHEDGHWYKQIAYAKERERGYAYTEDLYVPGYFEVPIAKDKPVYFTAALSETDPSGLGVRYEQEKSGRTPRDSFGASLRNAARQFYHRTTDTDGYLLAGYPWFGVRARDMLVALPGCSLYAGEPKAFGRVMNTVMPQMQDFMTQRSNGGSPALGFKDADVGVWAGWAIQQFAVYCGIDEARRHYGRFVADLVQYYLSNRHPNARVRPSGLLYITGDGSPLTWMDAKTPDGKAIVAREGYTVELNALWYNLLCFHRELCGTRVDEELSRRIELVGESFRRTFINQYGYLYDYVIEDGHRDLSVRPNMLLAASLSYSPLDDRARRSILDIITRELRTPKGLRSLSPNSEGYKPYCRGTQIEREYAYYNGSVWPWLLGAYFEAYLRLHKHGGRSYVSRMLIGMEEELREHGLSTISELYDGTPPYVSRGAISFAMSVGEILRTLALLQRADQIGDRNPLFDYHL